MLFLVETLLLDGPLDMPCLPDRQTKSPCRSCRPIRHTAYFLSSHATHDFFRILFIHAFNLSVFHLLISYIALCPSVVSVSPLTYQLHRIKFLACFFCCHVLTRFCTSSLFPLPVMYRVEYPASIKAMQANGCQKPNSHIIARSLVEFSIASLKILVILFIFYKKQYLVA